MTARRRVSGLMSMVALLALGALVLVTATWAAPARRTAARAGVADSNEVLVRLGKDTITRGDLTRRINTLPEQFRSNYATPDGRKQLLDRMVEEKVWLVEASRHGLAERPAVRQQIEQQRRDLLIRTYLNELMAKNPAVSDDEAEAYYKSHDSEFTIPASIAVRHIQSKSEADAKRVKQMARNQDWVTLAKKFSADTLTRNSGGNLGLVTHDGAFGTLGNQPALAESAFTLAEGQVGGPWKSDKGWHVVRVDQKKPQSTRPLDQVKPLIQRQLASQHQQDFYKTQLDSARKALGVKADSAAIKRFVSQRRTAREMFNDAQAMGPAEQRIDAYQKLLVEYPESDVSPQAQFMIGFIYSEELKKYDEAEQAFKGLLAHYPKAELAPSATWMIEHMRTNEAPAFTSLDGDSTGALPAPAAATKKSRASPPPPSRPGMRP